MIYILIRGESVLSQTWLTNASMKIGVLCLQALRIEKGKMTKCVTKNTRTRQPVVLVALAILSTGGVIVHGHGVCRVTISVGLFAANSPSNSSGTASTKHGYEALMPVPVLAPDVPEIGLAAFKGDIVTLRRLISSGANMC